MGTPRAPISSCPHHSCLAAWCHPDLFSNSQRCCTGDLDTHSREHTQVKCFSVMLCAKLLWNVYRGATCASLLEWAREVSWMLPTSSGLLVTLWCIPCSQCLSLPKAPGRQDKKKLCQESNNNFILPSLVGKINCMKQGDQFEIWQWDKKSDLS